MTLTDFRRLAPTADAAASRLWQKFETLKEESYLLYLDAREAWCKSPLYETYVEILIGALREGKTMEEFAALGKTLRKEEILEIGEVSSQLNT